MRNITLSLLLTVFVVLNTTAYAEGVLETKSTNVQDVVADRAKGVNLRSQANDLASLVKAKQFVAADKKALELRKAYESTFDKRLKQYTFQSQAEFQEFSRSSVKKFEWIDWGYKECLQTQAYLAAERRDFDEALVTLKFVESVAPVSASTATETGYILVQLGRPEEGLSAYTRALVLADKYSSQQAYRTIAMRGMGSSLIELKRLDEAEQIFIKSLEIEPKNKIALNELAYIRKLRGAK